MKYILTVAVAGLFANANAQNTPQVKVIRAINNSKPAEVNMHAVLDKLHAESANTVVYPLVSMTRSAFAKVQNMKKQPKKERIRTNNNAKPKRASNPNRV